MFVVSFKKGWKLGIWMNRSLKCRLQTMQQVTKRMKSYIKGKENNAEKNKYKLTPKKSIWIKRKYYNKKTNT
jgi:hypothetical protein